MPRQPVTRADVVRQLLELGVERGGVLLVHTSFSRVAPIEGGPTGLIEALRDALGLDGTLVMPSMSDDDDHPFDPDRTGCIGMGIVAETFRRLPGVRRSNSPHAFAAAGRHATAITADHPLEVPHGLNSPVGRVFELDGQVLLLGVGHDANTSVHLAEAIAGVRYRVPKHATVLEGGRVVRRQYAETDHCCERFSLLDSWLDAEGAQRQGPVGHGEARLARSRSIVDVAVAHLREHETIFLHAQGHDTDCDAAWASLAPDTSRS
jgi:aminoglycoside N3'-acetyltransferase